MATPPAVEPVDPQVSQVPWRKLFVRVSNAEAETVAAAPTAKGSRFWPEKTPTKLRPRFFGKAPIVRRPSPSGVSKSGRVSNAFGAGGPSRGSGSWARSGRDEHVRTNTAATTVVPLSFFTLALLPRPSGGLEIRTNIARQEFDALPDLANDRQEVQTARSSTLNWAGSAALADGP